MYQQEFPNLASSVRPSCSCFNREVSFRRCGSYDPQRVLFCHPYPSLGLGQLGHRLTKSSTEPRLLTGNVTDWVHITIDSGSSKPFQAWYRFPGLPAAFATMSYCLGGGSYDPWRELCGRSYAFSRGRIGRQCWTSVLHEITASRPNHHPLRAIEPSLQVQAVFSNLRMVILALMEAIRQ